MERLLVARSSQPANERIKLMREGRRWLAELLTLAGAEPRTATRAKALLGAGNLAYSQGDHASAELLTTESIVIGREMDDFESGARSQHRLGVIAVLRGQYAAASTYLEDSLARFRTMDDQRGITWSLAALGWLRHFQGDSAAAQPLLEESVAIYRQVRDTYGTAEALHLLAQVVERRGDPTTARAYEVESLAIWREIRDPRNMAFTIVVLGRLAFAQGDIAAARVWWNEGLRSQGARSLVHRVLSRLLRRAGCVPAAPGAGASSGGGDRCCVPNGGHSAPSGDRRAR